MAVVGPSCRQATSRHLSAPSSGAMGSSGHQAILAAAQPFYNSSTALNITAPSDRPIGYGAFGVVWYVLLSVQFSSQSFDACVVLFMMIVNLDLGLNGCKVEILPRLWNLFQDNSLRRNERKMHLRNKHLL